LIRHYVIQVGQGNDDAISDFSHGLPPYALSDLSQGGALRIGQSQRSTRHEEQEMDPTVGVRQRLSESGTLLQNENLAAENRILRMRLPARV
jgi:hypothetical protein